MAMDALSIYVLVKEGVELARLGSVANKPSPSDVRTSYKIVLEYLNLFCNWLVESISRRGFNGPKPIKDSLIIKLYIISQRLCCTVS